MSSGAVITGTITPGPSATGFESVSVNVCEVATGSGGYQYTTNCQWLPYVASAGDAPIVYSATVTPGSTVVVYASGMQYAGGAYTSTTTYLTTYRGGYADSSTADLNNRPAGVDLITAPAAGGVLANQDIAMVQAASMSGTVYLPAGHTFTGYAYTLLDIYKVGAGADGQTLQYAPSADMYTSAGASSVTYTADNLVPGQKYVVCVAASSNMYTPADLLTTCHGGYATTDSSVYGVVVPGMTPETAPTDGTTKTGVDITMAAGATITGTVYLPDGKTPAMCAPILRPLGSDSEMGGSIYARFANDGSYSALVVPGQSYVAYARGCASYATAWRGGFIGENPTLPNSQVTVMTPKNSGDVLDKQDIVLSEGSSISGTINVGTGQDRYTWVEACQVDAEGNQSDCLSARTDANGKYTIAHVNPGAQYVVDAYTYCGQGGNCGDPYLPGYYGGFVGDSPVLPNAKVTPVTAAATGGNVPDIDITLVKGVTVTGQVSPQSVVDTNDSIEVAACPVFNKDGQDYYVTWLPSFGQGISPLAATTNSQADVGDMCQATYLSRGDNTYSLTVAPGVDYVVIATGATGYADAWHGGLIQNAQLNNAREVSSSPPQPVPATGVTLISGQPGDTLTNVNIVFGASVAVTFDSDGGTPATAEQATRPGGTVTLPTEPTKTHFVFGGWYTGKNGAGTQFTASTPVPSSITVYAKWTPAPTYTLTYDANGGSGTVTDSTAYYAGDVATVQANGFTLAGSTFAGWNTKADGSGTSYAPDTTVTMTGNTTLYAQWVTNATYTLTYDANGGSGTVTDSTAYHAGDKATLKANALTLVGSTFVAWNTKADGSGTSYAPGDAMTITGDTTLYAQWTMGSIFTVTYDPNGGSGTVTDDTAYLSGGTAKAKANGFMLAGSTFVAWNTKADGSGAVYAPGDSITVTGNVTLYAQWVPVGEALVTYDPNGGSGTVTDDTTYKVGGTATLKANAFTRTHATFSGWNTKPDGSGTSYAPGDKVVLTGSVLLYAQWLLDPVYQVVYNPNGGQGTVLDPTVYYSGDEAKALANAYTLAGKRFTGWNTKADGSGEAYAPHAAITVTGDVTLYAQWADTVSAPTGGAVSGGQGLSLLAGLFVVVGVRLLLVSRRAA